ncbi:hypothetical protein NX722_24235 [Endozoicomonas gorgoniicola]|uniref:Uncharacterized protein n=1 Tax=Endozoicomonas gorgoniicola TaxID=1234144 RepID=A0ABT3N222_9GAMM|nr:hypothetical protein [Endozoicomonas gorgoniicola]MCW7555679.1 hypothetical protein [Endozoicomonas gorgoniicola]
MPTDTEAETASPAPREPWSIWMTVFADDADMLNRLIQALPGAAQNCFDANGQPVTRPGGQL